MLSHSVVSDSVTLWTVAHQAPLSLVFLRQEYWSGLPFPSPGDLPNSGIKSESFASSALQEILYHWAIREAPFTYTHTHTHTHTHTQLYTDFNLRCTFIHPHFLIHYLLVYSTLYLDLSSSDSNDVREVKRVHKQSFTYSLSLIFYKNMHNANSCQKPYLL